MANYNSVAKKTEILNLLDNVIREADDLANLINKDLIGLGGERCAQSLRNVASKGRTIRHKVSSVNVAPAMTPQMSPVIASPVVGTVVNKCAEDVGSSKELDVEKASELFTGKVKGAFGMAIGGKFW